MKQRITIISNSDDLQDMVIRTFIAYKTGKLDLFVLPDVFDQPVVNAYKHKGYSIAYIGDESHEDKRI